MRTGEFYLHQLLAMPEAFEGCIYTLQEQEALGNGKDVCTEDQQDLNLP